MNAERIAELRKWLWAMACQSPNMMCMCQRCMNIGDLLALLDKEAEALKAPSPGQDERALAVLDEMVNKIVVDPSIATEEIRSVPRQALAHLRSRLARVGGDDEK